MKTLNKLLVSAAFLPSMAMSQELTFATEATLCEAARAEKLGRTSIQSANDVCRIKCN